MKTALLFTLLLLGGFAANAQTLPAPRMQAKPGETVLVAAHTVKADKCKQYEHFVHDIFWPGAKKLSAAGQQVFRQTRIMHPARANDDGTYTYLFIMDPYIVGEDYNIESLTKKMYGEKQGAEHYKLFEDARVPGRYIGYRTIQSKD